MEILLAGTTQRTEAGPDPGVSDGGTGRLELVIPYTNPESTRTALDAAARLAHGLDALVALVAVHVVPFPCPLSRPLVDVEHLRRELLALIGSLSMPVRVSLILARDRELALARILKPRSIVLIATRRRWWRTAEEKLARSLARAGHNVTILVV
jgi:hypothetical protein